MTSARPIDPAYQDQARYQSRRTILLGAHLFFALCYFVWRTTVFNEQAPLFSLVFYLTELGGFLGSILLFTVILRRRSRTPLPAEAGHSVDIFIPTLNEDIDVVRRAVVASLRVRYPHETWLLDDGDRPEFRRMAEELGCRYLARRERTGAKAGNLNHALKHASGKYVVIFDADHCPQTDFLDRLLGYFRDPRVCLVQTPQDYYNLNSFQHSGGRRTRWIWHDQSGFHHIEQTGRDTYNSATLCGCSCVLRRSHLDEIGGFPADTVTEDMHAAVRMQKLGYKTVYHDEPLAFGVAPADLIGFVRQRLRWGEGNMQVCRAERLPMSRKLTLFQNLSYLLLGFAYLDSWRKLVLYGAPIATLFTGIPPLHGEVGIFLLFFVPYLASGIIAYQELYSGFGRILKTETYTMGRLAAGLGATWGLFRKNIRFRVSSKALTGQLPVVLIAPQILIFTTGASAIGVALVKETQLIDHWNPSGIPYWILFLLIALTAYHCWLAADLIWSAWRSGREQETAYSHHVKLPVRISTSYASIVVWTDLVSIDAATLLPEPGLALAVGSDVQAEIFLPNDRLSLKCRVEPSQSNGIELRFVWPSLEHRDRLDQSLHASRWHRLVMGKHEVVLSPFERILRSRSPATRRPGASSVWTPLLVRVANDASDLRLAYLRGPVDGGQVLELLCFGDWRKDRAEIVAADSSNLAGKTIDLKGLSDAPLLDAGSLDALDGRRYAVEVQTLENQILPGLQSVPAAGE